MPNRKLSAAAKKGSAAGKNGSAAGKRRHIVLIPGFGGFDALGRVNYYAGITELFEDWTHDPDQHWTPDDPDMVLHYFDNLPTAAVVTRAQRLRNYLAKRMARGEIRFDHDHPDRDDEIILIGHSTGGLDIRRLICDLHPPSGNAMTARIAVDGVHQGWQIKPKDLLGCIKKVVFLSVPHWGTNIAEWVKNRKALRITVIRDLQAAFLGSQNLYLDRIEACLAGGAAALTDAQLFLALRDALTEANYDRSDPPSRIADALEAASKLELYFNQMNADFAVIEDLTPGIDQKEPEPWKIPISPAHFSPKQRDEELKFWESLGIECLSYATLGGRAFTFGSDAPVFHLTNLLDDLKVAQACGQAADTDISYRFCYRACAGGSLKKYLPKKLDEIRRVAGPRPPELNVLEVWDNDGIVNTVSMRWPLAWPKGEIALVQADHLDIVGHFRLKPEKTDNAADEPPPEFSVVRHLAVDADVRRRDIQNGMGRNLQFRSGAQSLSPGHNGLARASCDRGCERLLMKGAANNDSRA